MMVSAISTSLLLFESPPLFHPRRCRQTVTSVLPPSIGGIRWKRRKERSLPRHLIKANSFDGLPKDLVEDSKFVPLNEDDPIYGPPVLLLVGFTRDETPQVLQFLKVMEGEFLQVIHCTEDMLRLSVWEAMQTQQTKLESVEIAKSLPRVCLLSGLSGEEMIMFVDAFQESGLKPSAFAALVPNSANKLLGEVIEEIKGDHEMLSGKQPA